MAEEFGRGILIEPPSVRERVGSLFRGFRVEHGFEPRFHPKFAPYIGRAWNQHATNACTGFATTKLATAMLAADGDLDGELSPLFPYFGARRKRHEYIRDNGSYLRDVEWAINDAGLCHETTWPGFSLNAVELKRVVNERPSTAAFSEGQKLRRKYRFRLRQIVDNGERLMDRVLHSLNKHQGIVVSIPVTNDFYKSGVLTEQRNTSGAPLHLVALYDWRKDSGRYVVRGINSWGEMIHDRGKFEADASFVAQARQAHYLERLP
jgi:hypothetical protein